MKDICVIGAGLAGLYTAKTAAIHGASVTVYERKEKVGSPLKCGEMFTCIYGRPPAESVFREIKEWIFDFRLVKGLEKTGLIPVELPDGFCVMTDRESHEVILYNDCIELGVEFVFGKTANPENMVDDFTIMATGTNQWGHRTAYAKCYTVQCEPYHRDINYAYFKMSPDVNGYYWAFPKTGNELNIGWGCNDKSDAKPSDIDYAQVIKEVTNASGMPVVPIRMMLKGGGRIPINTSYTDKNNYISEYNVNTIHVGDMAGLVNPMLMGGEHLAMLSGQLAGYICAKGTNSEEIEKEYYKAITEIIAPEMSIGIMSNNMREILSSDEFYTFMQGISGSNANPYNDFMLKYIKRTMSKHMKVPDVSNNELKRLL